MKTVEQNKSGPVYSPRRQSRWVLSDSGGKKYCGKGEFWAWNEI